MKSIKTILFFLLIINSISIFAQFVSPGVIRVDSIGYINVTGYIEKNRKPLENASIIVYESNKKVANIRTSQDGKFSLKLEFNKYFKVEITKKDLVTKKFAFDTYLPVNVDNHVLYSFDFNIVLFPRYDYIDMKVLDNPLAIIKYQNKYNDFFYDYNYAKSINDKVIDLQKKVEALIKEYSKSVDEGRRLFDSEEYKESLTKFLRAHDIYPDELYPIEQIALLNNILNKEKIRKESYNQLIAKAEENVNIKKYENAIDLLGQALQVIPTEKYPVQRIKEIRKLMEKLAMQEEKYKQTIEKADNSYSNKLYQDASNSYTEASNLFPDRSYPKDKIAEINKIISRMNNEALYNIALKEGDQLLNESKYKEAIIAYNKALSYKPDMKYPKERIDFINKKLSEQTYIENEYNKLIKEADNLLKVQDYEKAKNAYIEATKLKPSEQYPKDKIQEIDKIFADAKLNQELYNKAIAVADENFANKEYEKALESYQNALTYKPGEKYPEEQISKINDIIGLKTKRESVYSNMITNADKLFDNKEYSKAKIIYEDALTIKPDAKYPKERISNIDKLLAQEENKLQTYWKLLDKADESMDMQEWGKAKDLYLEASEIQPNDNYSQNKVAELNRIIESTQTQEELYNKLIVSADLASTTKDYERAIELYRKAAEIKPEEKYPKKKLKEIEDFVKGLEAYREYYNSTILKADELFDLQNYNEAREMYKKAHEIISIEKYPKQRIAEINKILQAEEYLKAIGEINNELIERLTEKKFTYNPVTNKQTSDYIEIEARNLSDKPYKILVFYGKDDERSGGFELNAKKQDKVEKYLIRLGAQDNWLKLRNNWISIQPIGGDLEVKSIQIFRGE
jgi:tetratricopeptide (TPR) repeat protein